MSEQEFVPLFRGATKQAMLFGVPLIPLITFCSPVIVITAIFKDIVGYSILILPIMMIAGVLMMREVSKRDDQYLNMFILDLKEKAQLIPNRFNGIIKIPPTPIRSKRLMEDKS